MNLTLRPGTPEDAAALGPICYEAFAHISSQHNFPPDFPDAAFATGMLASILTVPETYSVVAELDGRVVGSNFLWEGDPIAGVGPITVHPEVQNGTVGRSLMNAVLERSREKGFPGVRLVQAAFHNRSLALYTKLGFTVREPLACMQGEPLEITLPGYPVRPAVEADLAACAALCRRVHGHDRTWELAGAVARGAAAVVEREGRIVGYTSGVGFMAHTVAEDNTAIKALIGAAPEFPGPGFLLPTRNTELFRWCLDRGLRITQPLNLMSLGLYNEPQGAFLPSILL